MVTSRKESADESREIVGKYVHWANRVINALVVDFRQGDAVIPEDFRIQGVNIVRRENGNITVGFVFTKEE